MPAEGHTVNRSKPHAAFYGGTSVHSINDIPLARSDRLTSRGNITILVFGYTQSN